MASRGAHIVLREAAELTSAQCRSGRLDDPGGFDRRDTSRETKMDACALCAMMCSLLSMPAKLGSTAELGRGRLEVKPQDLAAFF